MADHILVAFEGDGGGTDTLSWGQWEIWRSMTAVGSSLSMGAAYPAPPGTTVASAAAMLRFMVSRHQSLRTRIVVDAAGRVRQEVATSGEVPLEIVDVTGGDTAAAEEATLVRHRYETTLFDYPHEWPVRMAVVRADGVPSYIVVVYCHVASDVHGLDALVADVLSMDGSPAAVTATQPLEQARQQRAPAALRHGRAALRHAERVLRTIPGHRFGESDDPREPRWWQVGYNSPASFPAVLAIAERNRVHTTPVLLAGFAVALCRITGSDPVATKLTMNNRFRPGFAQSVSPLAQSCLGLIEVADSTFDEVVVRAWRVLMLAGKHAYFDPNRMAELVAEVGRERGEDLHVDVCFNDRRRANLSPTLERMPTPAQLQAARADSTLRWEGPLDSYDHTVFFHVNDVADTFDYLMCADTHRLSPADMEAMVRSVEDMFLAAAFDPTARTGVTAARGTG